MIIFYHDREESFELRLPITSAVSALADVSPGRIETELRGSVDSDALKRVFEPKADGTPREGGKLALLVAPCEVTVCSNGWVEVKRVAE